MIGPVSRILARYIAGALVTFGFLEMSFAREIGADPDFALIIQTVLGALIGIGVEAWYWFAKRMGWAT